MSGHLALFMESLEAFHRSGDGTFTPCFIKAGGRCTAVFPAQLREE